MDKPSLTVAEAQRLRVCRVCQVDNFPREGNPLVLSYGAEYAHRMCIFLEKCRKKWAANRRKRI